MFAEAACGRCLGIPSSFSRAATAYLLGCVYNGNGGEKEEDNTKKKKTDLIDNVLRQCERECNEQFMSLFPVAERWIGSDTTLYARS